MDAVKFIEAYNEIKKRCVNCGECQLEHVTCRVRECGTIDKAEKLVSAVEEWGETHLKTIGDTIRETLPEGAAITLHNNYVDVTINRKDWDKLIYTE